MLYIMKKLKILKKRYNMFKKILFNCKTDEPQQQQQKSVNLNV